MRRYFLLMLLAAVIGAAQAQTKPQPAKRPATKGAPSKPTAKPAANEGDATVAPGETVELGRASTDYNGRPSTYKKPARKPMSTDAATLPGGQGVYAAPGQPVQPVEKARDDYDGRPVPAAKKPARPTTRTSTTRP